MRSNKEYLVDLLKMSNNFTSYLRGETPFEQGEELNPNAFGWNARTEFNGFRRFERAYRRAAIIGGRRSRAVVGKEQADKFVQAVVACLNGDKVSQFWQSVIEGVYLV